jgi:hypothetical protein
MDKEIGNEKEEVEEGGERRERRAWNGRVERMEDRDSLDPHGLILNPHHTLFCPFSSFIRTKLHPVPCPFRHTSYPILLLSIPRRPSVKSHPSLHFLCIPFLSILPSPSIAHSSSFATPHDFPPSYTLVFFSLRWACNRGGAYRHRYESMTHIIKFSDIHRCRYSIIPRRLLTISGNQNLYTIFSGY